MNSIKPEDEKTVNVLRKSYGELNDLNFNSIIAISRAAQVLHRSAAKDCKEGGLTLSQFGVLEILYHKGDLRICELIDKTLSTSGNMTVVIENLVRLGLIKKRKDAIDRRAMKIAITLEGKRIMETIFPNHIKSVEEIFQPLTKDEKATLISLLKKLTQYK